MFVTPAPPDLGACQSRISDLVQYYRLIWQVLEKRLMRSLSWLIVHAYFINNKSPPSTPPLLISLPLLLFHTCSPCSIFCTRLVAFQHTPHYNATFQKPTL